jgi:putative alpha-1,2-mannosidase
MTVNGEVCNNNYITHATLTKGSNICFTMSSKPNKQRGTAKSSVPYSFSNDK